MWFIATISSVRIFPSSCSRVRLGRYQAASSNRPVSDRRPAKNKGLGNIRHDGCNFRRSPGTPKSGTQSKIKDIFRYPLRPIWKIFLKSQNLKSQISNLFLKFTCKRLRRYSREQVSQSFYEIGGESQTGDAPVMLGSDTAVIIRRSHPDDGMGGAPFSSSRSLVLFFCLLFCFFETTCLRAQKKIVFSELHNNLPSINQSINHRTSWKKRKTSENQKHHL